MQKGKSYILINFACGLDQALMKIAAVWTLEVTEDKNLNRRIYVSDLTPALG